VYASHFGSYDETYGSLGGVVVLMLWLYLTALVVVLGAEINAALETQTVRDSTTGPEQPLGARGAEAADSVPTD
jgi:membrane protein